MSGASARYSCFRIPVETITAPRRRKLHIPRFRLTAKARSFRCSSSPNVTRLSAGLTLGPLKRKLHISLTSAWR